MIFVYQMHIFLWYSLRVEIKWEKNKIERDREGVIDRLLLRKRAHTHECNGRMHLG